MSPARGTSKAATCRRVVSVRRHERLGGHSKTSVADAARSMPWFDRARYATPPFRRSDPRETAAVIVATATPNNATEAAAENQSPENSITND